MFNRVSNSERYLQNGEPLYSPYITSASVAAGAQAVNRSSIAALAFLVWDILITTDEEVRLIWPRSWSYNKFVYFFIRYVPMMMQVSILFIGTELTPSFHFTPHDCYIWQVYQGVAASLILMAIDTILILRVFALYHENIITMRRVVAIFFIVEVVGMAIGLGLSLPGITYDNLCLVINVPRSIIIYAAAAILFQAFLFMVTIYKFVLAVRSGWGDVPFIVLLTRDGTWAFCLLFFTYAGHLILYGLHNPAYAGVLYAWLLTIFSFCGYRILLNLNHLAYEIHGINSSSTNPRTNTNIQFSALAAACELHELTSQGSSGSRTFQSSHISHLSLEP